MGTYFATTFELCYPEDVMERRGRQHAGSIKPANTPMCGGHDKSRPRGGLPTARRSSWQSARWMFEGKGQPLANQHGASDDGT